MDAFDFKRTDVTDYEVTLYLLIPKASLWVVSVEFYSTSGWTDLGEYTIGSVGLDQSPLQIRVLGRVRGGVRRKKIKIEYLWKKKAGKGIF